MTAIFDNLRTFIGSGGNVAFAVLAVVMIGSSVFMINFTRVVHMVVSLSLVFLSMAGMFILLDAEFVAFVQVLIYAGAISILMIFGIMMTQHDKQDEAPKRPLHNVLLFVGAVALFGVLFYAIQDASFAPPGDAQLAVDNTRQLGLAIFQQYVLPFELISVLLTVAFIGSVVVAKREEA